MTIEHPQSQDVAALRQLWKEAFSDPDSYLDLFFSTTFFCDHCLCVWEDGRLRSAAYWMDCEIAGQKAAYIYAVATAEGSRGRGFCRALMEEIHCTLFNRGYCGSILVPGDGGLRKMYSAMGYRDFGSVRRFSPASGHGQMQKIGREEFALRRRRMLPAGGVIQEGENLAFLSRLVKFYRGEACVFCAGVNDDRLFCLELLGDRQLASAITGALGANTGTFRIPGEEPFAMYRGLSATPAPSYFAFSFD
jgi:ribosomal protein S18 acetylase RimI-like enzyme